MKRIFIKLLLYDGFYGLFHRMIAESQPTIAPFMPLFAYLLGSIPFGLLLTKLAGMGDIRTIGSGNIGATNVLRTGKKGLAALTLVCDALKGVVAVMIGQHYTPTLGLVAGVAALLGHSYPIWLKYKGGKGVATAFGFSCALNLPMGAAIGFTWIVVLVMVRYSSVAALSAAALAPLYAWLFGNTQLMLAYVGISSFIIWRHRANIKRLLNGTEGTLSLGSKNKTAASPTTESSPDTAADETSPPE